MSRMQTEAYDAIMQTMRDSWTDERLDDLREEVRDGFLKVDERFEKVDGRFREVDRRFEHMEHRIDEKFEAAKYRSDKQFEAMMDRFDRKFDALYLLIFRFGGAAILALVGLIVTQL